MINFTKEGAYKKIGLNFYRAAGGFVVAWLWYTPANHKLYGWRFRLRMHIKPRILWSVESSDVIKSYLWMHDCELVEREVLNDLKELQEGMKVKDEPLCYVKPS